jgi:hypothetical protein
MPEGVDEDAEKDALLEDVVINQVRQAQPEMDSWTSVGQKTRVLCSILII